MLAVEKQLKNQTINFDELEYNCAPFKYFVSTEGFNTNESEIILSWLETSAPWKLIKADFYTQYEFDFEEADLPEEIAFLKQRDFLDYLIKKFEKIFDTNLDSQVDITAHKLIKDHTIRLHNDYVPGQETHRLLIQLNRNWRDENGGFLMFFDSSNPQDIHRVIRPVHNSSTGFAISLESNHAVSTIHDGERYTLVYSFYAARHNE